MSVRVESLSRPTELTGQRSRQRPRARRGGTQRNLGGERRVVHRASSPIIPLSSPHVVCDEMEEGPTVSHRESSGKKHLAKPDIGRMGTADKNERSEQLPHSEDYQRNDNGADPLVLRRLAGGCLGLLAFLPFFRD